MLRTPQGRGVPRRVVAAITVMVLLLSLLPSQASPVVGAGRNDGWAAAQVRQSRIPARDRELAGQLPGRAKVGYHPETGRVRFISGTPSVPLSDGPAGIAAGARQLSAADARTSARRFVERYGPLFGVRDAGRELRVKATRRQLAPSPGLARAGAGRPNATVRFEQVRDGVPVMGGEIAVQLGAEGEVLSAAGEVLPSAAASPASASVGVAQARRAAAAWTARETGRAASTIGTTSEGLGLYDPRLMDDPSLASVGTRLVWRIDTRLPADGRKPHDRRLVLVDALGGDVLTTIARVYGAEGPNRRVCDNRSIPGRAWSCNTPYTRSEGQPASGIGDVDAVYRIMGVTYDYFYDRFGRDGIDGKGSRMKAMVRHCASYCPWRNAEWRWSEQQATFGTGWAKADDVVAHEFTHGVLDAEAPLFYQYQSGAINESYADVFGELIDLSYGGGNDSVGSRWKMGEDTPIGVFRDMRKPGSFGHADRVRSPKWHTGPSDDGGVHRNSGVGNKAASLVADGGTHRGIRVKAIGRTRTARVWYQALTTRLTPAANYIDLADALVAGCTDLVGTMGMTLAHCKSVRDATRATQMSLQPRSFGPKTAPLCPAGRSAIDVLNDDLENPGAGRWVSSKLVGNLKGWYYPQNPNNVRAWDGTWASSGRFNFYAPNRGTRSDTTMRLREALTLPNRAYLRFGHGYSFDKDAKRRYDGGILEIRVDGGSWRGVGGLFTHGGYNGTIARSRGNPLHGKRAWTGDSHGWSKARIDLSDFAGSRVKLRFRMASDRSVGARGWYIDDIRVYTCANDDDAPIGSLSINGGAANTSNPDVTLSLDWDDATTWVTTLRVSGSPKLNAGGKLLANAISMPVRQTLAWDLADRTYGGPAGPGTRRVYGQVRDAAGNWSEVFSDQIELLAR
jgi:bacillolysin